MNTKLFRVMTLVAVLFSLFVACDAVWALKNVCPACKKMVENQDLAKCPLCGFAVNKCLTCGFLNPIKNDNCEKCSASLAESRVSRTITKETRDDLQLGESPRAKIDVELGQIANKIEETGLTPELAARQVELYTQMSWWSKANSAASEFSAQFPNAPQIPQVISCRVIALRTLGYLALEAKNKDAAREYLKTALTLDPRDTESQGLMKIAGGAK